MSNSYTKKLYLVITAIFITLIFSCSSNNSDEMEDQEIQMIVRFKSVVLDKHSEKLEVDEPFIIENSLIEDLTKILDMGNKDNNYQIIMGNNKTGVKYNLKNCKDLEYGKDINYISLKSINSHYTVYGSE